VQGDKLPVLLELAVLSPTGSSPFPPRCVFMTCISHICSCLISSL
jgi:hypothetical protein